MEKAQKDKEAADKVKSELLQEVVAIELQLKEMREKQLAEGAKSADQQGAAKAPLPCNSSLNGWRQRN